MVRNNQGLTDTYNRFHDPTETHPDILHLRHLHDQMDRAVLAAYGWPDIDTTCGFALDYLDTDPDDLPPVAADRVASGDLFFPPPTKPPPLVPSSAPANASSPGATNGPRPPTTKSSPASSTSTNSAI